MHHDSISKVHENVFKNQAKSEQNINSIKLIKIDQLTLDSNNLTEFPEIFKNHPEIKHLTIANNSLPNFNNLPPTLEVLEVSGNQNNNQNLDITDLHKLIHLKHLELETCGFVEIPNPTIFTQFNYLTSLSLAGNLLTEIPTELKFCRKLYELDLSENHITDIGKDLSEFPALENLNISGNGLKEFICPSGIRNLLIHENNLEKFEIPAGLEQLQISNNDLKELDCTGKCNLIWIDFSKNMLRKLPKNIHQTVVKYCYGKDNQITNLPRTISRMRDVLEVLDLSDNDLDENLHENLAGLENLRILNLANNPKLVLKKVHCKFLMRTVSELNLSGSSTNYQGLVNILSFSTRNLERLSLRNCGLQEVPNSTIWENCSELKSVDFGDNSIHKIPDVVFQGLKKLETLILDKNEIDDNGLLGVKQCENLEELVVFGNNVKRVEKILLELRSLKKFSVLEFQDNPIEGTFHCRDSGMILELQRQIVAVRKISKFFKSKKIIKKFRKTVQLAREKSASEGKKGKKSSKGSKGSKKKK